jgi:hypothetical protein
MPYSMPSLCDTLRRAVARILCLFVVSEPMACQPTAEIANPESAPVVTTAALSRNDPAPGNTSYAGLTAPSAVSAQVDVTASAILTQESSGFPPSSANESAGSSTIRGCLSKPAALQNNPSRSTARPSDTQGFKVTPLGNGALVTHDFTHACCLSATIDTVVDGNTITVREHLVGTPCRCVCESTIQTRLNVPPGDYDVRLVTDTNGVQAQIGSKSLAVKRIMAR